MPEFHRLNRWSPGCLTLPWHERVADCDRRFGLSPTPEHVAASQHTAWMVLRHTHNLSMVVRAHRMPFKEWVESQAVNAGGELRADHSSQGEGGAAGRPTAR